MNKKIIKKLEKSKITLHKYQIKKFINFLEELGFDSVFISYDEASYNKYVFCINQYKNTCTLYYYVEDECCTREEISFGDLILISNGEDFKEITTISKMCNYKEASQKKEAIDKMLLKTLSSENRKFAQSIKNLIMVNEVIEKYNTQITQIFNTNYYSKLCKDILRDLTGDDCYGLIEIPVGNRYEELMLHLHLDNVNLYRGAATYEGSGIFADVGLQHVSHIINIQTFIDELDSAVIQSSKLNSMFEVSFDGTFNWANDNNDVQKFISFKEFECAIERQLYEIKNSQDIIFKNFYKILVLLKADMTACDILVIDKYQDCGNEPDSASIQDSIEIDKKEIK